MRKRILCCTFHDKLSGIHCYTCSTSHDPYCCWNSRRQQPRRAALIGMGQSESCSSRYYFSFANYYVSHVAPVTTHMRLRQLLVQILIKSQFTDPILCGYKPYWNSRTDLEPRIAVQSPQFRNSYRFLLYIDSEMPCHFYGGIILGLEGFQANIITLLQCTNELEAISVSCRVMNM